MTPFALLLWGLPLAAIGQAPDWSFHTGSSAPRCAVAPAIAIERSDSLAVVTTPGRYRIAWFAPGGGRTRLLPVMRDEIRRPTSGDVDADGLDDVVAVAEGDVVYLRRLDEMGRSWLPVRFPVPGGGRALAVGVGDVDGDGQPDLAVLADSGRSLRLVWLEAVAEPWLAEAWTSQVLATLPDGSIRDARLALEDCDADGDRDILFHVSAMEVSWLENPGGPPRTPD